MKEEIINRLKGKTVILCIGNVMRGDDGAGPAVAENIIGKAGVEVIDCGVTPENYTGKIKEIMPETVIMIDAVNMGKEPGSACIVEKTGLNELQLYTTHDIPLKLLADYLFIETKADIFLIGIQPESLYGNQISLKVAETVKIISNLLIEILAK